LERIIERRIAHFRDTLFDRFAKIVEAPPEHEVLVFDPSVPPEQAKGVLITNDANAIPVKGMSFTVAPETDEQEVAGWIAMTQKDPRFLPGAGEVWRLYLRRKELELTQEQCSAMAAISLLSEAPCFYWIREFDSSMLRRVLEGTFKRATKIQQRTNIQKMTAFLGRRYFKRMAGLRAKERSKISPSVTNYPRGGPRVLFSGPNLDMEHKKFRRKGREFSANLEEELADLVGKLVKSEGTGAYEKNRAHAIDCYLYARDDHYKRKDATVIKG
jgi:hypothetical protein